jgi:hypothetical protein
MRVIGLWFDLNLTSPLSGAFGGSPAPLLDFCGFS